MHHQVTVRRHQADAARLRSDFVVNADDAKNLGGHLRDLLRTAQAERGKGVWSDADPEVWMGSTLVGRLGPDGDAAQLARQAMEQLNALVGRSAS